MGKLDRIGNSWEQLFEQHKNQAGDSVVCLVNSHTKKRIYFDVQLNRLLSKKEATRYTIDLTGQFAVLASSPTIVR